MEGLAQSVFAAIVDDVAAGMYNVRNASAAGFHVEAEFASRSGKQSIYANLTFDGNTGRCTAIQCPTPGATQPLAFAKAVEREIEARA